jgi:fructokinase
MCNPLADILFKSPAELPGELGASPGSMNLVDSGVIDKILAHGLTGRRVPGGSGANTARGLAWLDNGEGRIQKPAFLGSVGDDSEGRAFEELLSQAGVESHLAVKRGEPTGVSAILVSPDHERTMFTSLGACRLLDAEDVPLDAVKNSAYIHITGYNWDTPNQEEAAKKAAAAAKKAGKKVSFDVADPFVAQRYGDSFRKWGPGNLDLLFANQEELAALTRTPGPEEDILKAAEEFAPLVIMKTGKKGCAILFSGKVLRVPGEKVSAVDTTAAGDSFAAGFFFGLLLGKDIETCAKAANRIASQMVTVEGCDYSRLEREKILQLL